ncbi:MAG: hypothetical protein V4596_09635 [Bdellovibrionota bacterium]
MINKLIILNLIILNAILPNMAFAQGPEYTGNIEQKPSKVEQRVNDKIISTGKRIEIEGQRKEMELKNEAPKNLQAVPTQKKRAPFIVNPKQQNPQDPGVFRDQYDHAVGKDPSTEFEQQVIENRNTPPPGVTNEEFVREFKENAARAGVKVEVDPKTLKARPVKDSTGNQ